MGWKVEIKGKEDQMGSPWRAGGDGSFSDFTVEVGLFCGKARMDGESIESIFQRCTRDTRRRVSHLKDSLWSQVQKRRSRLS